jgi:PKD repeat protein
MNIQRKQSQPSFSLETLEGRRLLSASGTVGADTTFSTTTTLDMATRTTVLGQTVTIKGVVSSSGGIDKGATVELLSDDEDTGLTGAVNHLGYYVFTLDASQAAYVGTDLWRIRVLTNGDFVGSKSRQLIGKVEAPKLTTESDGLEIATVTAGTGAAVKSGQTAYVDYTGFNIANGEVFDNTDAHDPIAPLEVITGSDANVIPGFAQEVVGMKVGQVNVAVLPPSLAYPSTDTESSLAGDTLVFVVTVVSIA